MEGRGGKGGRGMEWNEEQSGVEGSVRKGEECSAVEWRAE